jgi:hypothetical protein
VATLVAFIKPFAKITRWARCPFHKSHFFLWDGYLTRRINYRWVKMAQLIPWSEFEEDYAENFPTEMGAPAKSFRMALGALIIKEKLGISDA